MAHKRHFLPILFFFVVVATAFCGCSGHPPPAKMVFAKDAVTINYQADKQLNLVNNRPHTVLMVVYQLSALNAFNNYSGYRAGLVKLLDGLFFDKSVTAVHKVYVEPGAHQTLLLNRAEHTRHVAVVAGFDTLIPAKCVIVADITTTTARHGIWLKKMTTVDPLILNIVLGRDGLRLEQQNDS